VVKRSVVKRKEAKRWVVKPLVVNQPGSAKLPDPKVWMGRDRRSSVVSRQSKGYIHLASSASPDTDRPVMFPAWLLVVTPGCLLVTHQDWSSPREAHGLAWDNPKEARSRPVSHTRREPHFLLNLALQVLGRPFPVYRARTTLVPAAGLAARLAGSRRWEAVFQALRSAAAARAARIPG